LGRVQTTRAELLLDWGLAWTRLACGVPSEKRKRGLKKRKLEKTRRRPLVKGFVRAEGGNCPRKVAVITENTNWKEKGSGRQVVWAVLSKRS